jgi:hypothetical protein
MDDQPIHLWFAKRPTYSPFSRRTIRRHIKQQYLPAYRVARLPTICIKRQDVEDLLTPISVTGSEENRSDG